ncbi:MAG: hypothetical protein GY720_22970, partial [bacterium]|nr:hypothetical protein [bacterium]
GTDTMAWTSSALSFLLPGLSKPVTVTGSQLPLFYKTGSDPSKYQLLYNTDAVRNVEGGIQFLTMGIPEVGMYFADHLFRGNRAVKSNASEFVAFSSPNYHPLGEYGVLPTLYNQYVLPVPKSTSIDNNYQQVGAELATIAANIENKSVLQLLLFPAYYNEPDGVPSLLVSMLTQLEQVAPTLAGIIFESYGEGNIPSYQSMQELLTMMRKTDGKILVDCTQVFAGDVNYNAYATGAWLKDAGVISGHDMTPIAALAKLIVLLARDPSAPIDAIELQMGQSLAGELTSYYSISGYRNDFLAPGESLYSINGTYQFQNMTTGTLALFDVSDQQHPVVKWSENVGSKGRLVMQSDNNLVFYDKDYNPLWATNTPQIGHNSYFEVGNDGTLALYNMDTGGQTYVIYDPASPLPRAEGLVPEVPELQGIGAGARRR